jgi:hypothetical protein
MRILFCAGLVSPSPTDEGAAMHDTLHAQQLFKALSPLVDEGTSQRRGSGWTSSEDEAEDMDHEGNFLLPYRCW